MKENRQNGLDVFEEQLLQDMQQEVGLNEGNNDNDVRSSFLFSKRKQGYKKGTGEKN